ncbi:MAG: SusC/RagA family TonB-linked outer membrane protein [Candidatus Pedobacter colombiensis]|uniref:SusC/RagA family TonB-linked outer membrane protein n=1 Tax=Candidatus Pedobacter colombiensis TaxID=3121371 RepID=A0AAJ5WB28_9SPHI|nr:SusC/RagA family TonB-linked outer membrane protein [Pedobacter sp.]WEK19512.1 MAG: SusC/RagA family TonB-linked outer membrane protein [Pedobacter sp.]
MKEKLLLLIIGSFLLFAQSFAQQKTIRGKVLDEDRLPMPGVSVRIKGAMVSTQTGSDGLYSIKVSPGQILVFSFIGALTQEKVVGKEDLIDVLLRTDANQLSEVTVTGALGIQVQKRSQGSAIQTISGAEVAQTQRENFINSLQGRIAGVDVVNSSGTPGASSQITIRGISSVSSSNQPLMVVDGMPMDNNTFNTGALATRSNALNNSGVDFTNRSSDFSPEDIEEITVLKGPEAAALYGIDAANGAILITTKRGKAGEGRINYSNSVRFDHVTKPPAIQDVYSMGRNGVADAGYIINYFGPKYAPDVKRYDNIGGFFKTSVTQKHNLSFEGGNDKANYRVSGTYNQQNGVIPNTTYDRYTLTGATRSQVNNWLNVDLSFTYSNADNNQPFRGNNGVLMNLLFWPATDDAKNYLNPDGSRRKLNFTGETDNPYFNNYANYTQTGNNRIYTTTALNFTLAKWLTLDTRIGYDTYANTVAILRHPESARGSGVGGQYDEGITNTRNLTLRGMFSGRFDKVFPKFGLRFNLGVETRDDKSKTTAISTENFLDPNFVSVNNSVAESRFSKTSIIQRRLMGVYGNLVMNYDRLVYLTLTGRNDWSSTLPVNSYSFFYPSASLSFVFTDLKALSGIKSVVNEGKLRASVAQVGRDATPYRVFSSLEYKEVVGGGFGYGFYGPNPKLRPEMVTGYEFGTELSFLKSRLALDFAYYHKVTKDQIIGGIRSSYATQFILSQINGGVTKNWGYEVMLNAKPIVSNNFAWSIIVNFAAQRNVMVSLPKDLPDTYNSDSAIYGDVRSASVPGLSITSFTSRFWLKNKDGEILINPSSGLPILSLDYIPNGSERWPDWTMGVTNRFGYKNFNLSFLLDIRKGGDVLNGTQRELTTRGLSLGTLNREEPKIIKGVIRDGLENSANPTKNNIVILPYLQDAYYITGAVAEQFIEKNVNYLRMRDITLSYTLPAKFLAKQKFVKSASVFTTITDVFMITNYTGLDPVNNGNSAAVGGPSAIGVDIGNFAMPTGFNFGLKVGF